MREKPEWEKGSALVDGEDIGYRTNLMELFEEIRYRLNSGGGLDFSYWAAVEYTVQTLYEEVEVTERELPLLQRLVQSIIELFEATRTDAPALKRRLWNQLPHDLYLRWKTMTLLLMALWDSQGATLELFLLLSREPQALSAVGVSVEELPEVVQKRLQQVPALLKWYR